MSYIELLGHIEEADLLEQWDKHDSEEMELLRWHFVDGTRNEGVPKLMGLFHYLRSTPEHQDYILNEIRLLDRQAQENLVKDGF